MKIIYDIGSNNGDDLPYYLKKADMVVAVEANPLLTDEIKANFAGDIAAGRLVVESCVVTVADAEPIVPFYVHKGHHVLSQVTRPDPSAIDQFEEVALPTRGLMDIISQYGPAHYIKIDIEHYDHVLLKELFRNGVRPPYLSAESHSIEVFCALVSMGGYEAFKLIDGPSIPHVYGAHEIETLTGREAHSFPDHSAGPFGNDTLVPG